MSEPLRRMLVLFVSILASSSILNAGPANKLGPTSAVTAHSSNMPMAMPLYAPLFIESQNYASTLTMVNELTATVHATVVVRRLDGSTIGQRVVTFSPHSREVVHVQDILNPGTPEAIGSLEVIPDPMEVQTMAIAAQLSMVDTRQSPPVYFEEEFLAPDPMKATQYRAVAPSSTGSAVVALLNTTAKFETLAITCLGKQAGSAPHNYSLSAFQLALLPACGDAMPADPAAAIEDLGAQEAAAAADGSATGIDVSSDTGMGTFAVWGIAPTRAEHAQTAISMNFINSAQMYSPSLIFAGVPVGVADLLGGEQFTPELAAANFALLPSTVTISYSRMSTNNPETKIVASFDLAAGAVREWKLPDLAGDPGMRNSFTVTSNAQPGAVIGNLISRGQELYPAVQLIGKDARDMNNGGGHPWSLANGDESTLLLFNHASKPVLFTVNIAGEGVFWNQRYTLTSNETYALDLKAIVTNQVPDASGKKLPIDAISGEASWFTPGYGEGTGRLVVTNPGAGLARNFSCGYDIVLCGSYMGTTSATFPVGGTGSLGPIYGNQCTAYSPSACSGQSYCTGCASGSYFWTSNNTSIASVDGSNTGYGATFYGNSPGTTSGQGSIASGTGCVFVSTGTLNVCGTPKGESTVFSQWGDNDPLAGYDAAAAGFIQTLSPAASQLVGGTVTESNASPATDGCYFNGSSYPPAAGVNGSSWTVGSGARWGPDYVGPAYARLGYYQKTRPAMGLPLPCNYTLFQQLAFKCPSGTSGVVYDSPVILNSVISGTGITNVREGVSAARTLKAY